MMGDNNNKNNNFINDKNNNIDNENNAPKIYSIPNFYEDKDGEEYFVDVWKANASLKYNKSLSIDSFPYTVTIKKQDKNTYKQTYSYLMPIICPDAKNNIFFAKRNETNYTREDENKETKYYGLEANYLYFLACLPHKSEIEIMNSNREIFQKNLNYYPLFVYI